ncbi:Gfo/Idh/MocA family protein [Cohnella terricola]|nr:Gfo/Idh/MocA family oxidoreductase [Cohnella terricola]
MKRLRWGILGCAAIADRAVIPAIQASETGELVGIASRNVEKARTKAEEFGIPKYYGSYEALLADKDIDAVYIPLPNHLHKEWTIAAAKASKHILCEKPLALNAAEAQEMVDFCKEAGVHLAEAFMYRHHPRIARVKEILAGGEIGELRAIRGVFTYNGAANRTDIRQVKAWGGGGLYDVGVYPLSAARWIVGAEPEAATVHALFSPEHDDVDMMASGMVEFKGGVALTFDCGMWATFRNELEIVGTDGTIVLKPSFLPNKETDTIEIYAGGKTRIEGPYGVDAYVAQSDQFARVVWGEEAPLYSAQDAVENMKLIDACLESARKRERVIMN